MATLHNLGFPRIGARRELKFAQEQYWRGETDAIQLQAAADELCHLNWQTQSGLDLVPVGDFTLYDHVLDMSFLLGHVPRRFRHGAEHVPALDQYFRVARGRAPQGSPVAAGEMTKWFDTNYHYIVPEFEADTAFELHAERLVQAVTDAQQAGVAAKPVILGPMSY
ncbi:MAG: 5-methyltetrahydropteroyltriglutamate--homocysteine S-methyltransferase, partial [Natronospirillum sp.]